MFITRDSHDLNSALYGGLLLRIGLGTVFIAHALQKLLVFTLPGTVVFFAEHGFPGWTAYPVFGLELAGGLALMLGYRTRWVAGVLIPVIGGALTVHVANGWFFANPGGGWEYIAFLILALSVQVLLGDGALAFNPNWVVSPGRTKLANPESIRARTTV